MPKFTPSRWRTLPIHITLFTAMVLVPVWYRLPYQPQFMPPFYVTRFALFIPLVLTVGLFALSGFPGIRTLAADKWRAIWALSLLIFALWMYGSAGWAFRREADPNLAIGAATQFAIVALSAISAASTRFPPSWAIAALIFGLSWNAVLVGQQVTLQESAGGLWKSLGEFPISVTQPRISVVQADGLRWLRPYGLLPHPNMLAGFLVVALLAAATWLIDMRRTRWLVGGIITAAGLWAFLLTFSRGAYLALAIGGLALLLLLWRTQNWSRRLVPAMVLIIVIGIGFAFTYAPYLLARTGQGGETTEQYSVAERAELNSAAAAVIYESPFIGVGAGNLPWRSAVILHQRRSIVQGNYPHNVWLSVAGELGVVGVAFFASALVSGFIAAYRTLIRQNTSGTTSRAALLAGFVALIVAGMFDYYPVTLLQFQTVWWVLVAVALAPSVAPVLSSSG